MSSPEAMQALAHAAAAVVARDDLAGSLVRLLDDCCRLLGAQAAGLLALAPDNSLELLSATSHASAELELYQIQLSEGPCLEAIKLSRPTGAESIEEICRRWPGFGAAAAEAGIGSLQALPMLWHGRVIGGLNIFRTQPGQFTIAELELCQAFTDVATITIVARQELTAAEVVSRVHEALLGRTIIEQAKGVLAYQQGTDMATAYDTLKRDAQEQQRTLSEHAARVIAGAHQHD